MLISAETFKLKVVMEIVSEKNTTGLTQLCRHSELGMLMRTRRSKYFYMVDDSAEKNYRTYDEVKQRQIPKHMIRKPMTKAEEAERFMCTGCGKMFKRTSMDGSLCRGYDGCSVKKEIGELQIFDIERRETMNDWKTGI